MLVHHQVETKDGVTISEQEEIMPGNPYFAFVVGDNESVIFLYQQLIALFGMEH